MLYQRLEPRQTTRRVSRNRDWTVQPNQAMKETRRRCYIES